MPPREVFALSAGHPPRCASPSHPLTFEAGPIYLRAAPDKRGFVTQITCAPERRTARRVMPLTSGALPGRPRGQTLLTVGAGRLLRGVVWHFGGDLLTATGGPSYGGQAFARLLIAFEVFRVLGTGVEHPAPRSPGTDGARARPRSAA